MEKKNVKNNEKRFSKMSRMIAGAFKKLWQGETSYENKSVDVKQKARFDQILADVEARTSYKDSMKADGKLNKVREQREANKEKASKIHEDRIHGDRAGL